MDIYSKFHLFNRSVRTRKSLSFCPDLLVDGKLENRVLMAGILDVSRNVWDISNNVIPTIVDTQYGTEINPATRKKETTTKIKIKLENTTNINFGGGGRTGRIDIILKGDVPEGSRPKSSGGSTSLGEIYIVSQPIAPNQTTTYQYTVYGRLPEKMDSDLQILVELKPPLPEESPTPPSGEKMEKVDIVRFDNAYKQSFPGNHTQEQIENLNTLVTHIQSDNNIKDVRWAAYMLATVNTEQSNFGYGLEGEGSYRDKPYTEEIYSPDGNPHRYIGRGYVQLTWAYNYALFGAHLANQGILPKSDELLNYPELIVNDSDLAYEIMSYGMRAGAFSVTGGGLDDYINGGRKNYEGARAIVNGTDKAPLIAKNAELFEKILKQSFASRADLDVRLIDTFDIAQIYIHSEVKLDFLPPIQVVGSFTRIDNGLVREVNGTFKPFMISEYTYTYTLIDTLGQTIREDILQPTTFTYSVFVTTPSNPGLVFSLLTGTI